MDNNENCQICKIKMISKTNLDCDDWKHCICLLCFKIIVENKIKYKCNICK